MARRGPALLPLPKKQRLRASEFQAVFQQRGRRVERTGFVAIWRAREGLGKVGFAVGRRVGGAVERNRARRRLREAFRRAAGAGLPGFDVVFVGRASAATCSFAELLREIEHVVGVLKRAAREDGGGDR